MAEARKARPAADSEIRFDVEDAGPVSALLRRPVDAERLLVLAHGAGAGMRHAFMEALARGLAERGIATFRFQFPYAEAGRRRPDPRAVSRRTNIQQSVTRLR